MTMKFLGELYMVVMQWKKKLWASTSHLIKCLIFIPWILFARSLLFLPSLSPVSCPPPLFQMMHFLHASVLITLSHLFCWRKLSSPAQLLHPAR